MHPSGFDVTLILPKFAVLCLLISILSIFLTSGPVSCADNELSAVRASVAPVVDGAMDECWSAATECTSFLNMNGSLPSDNRTSVRVMYDDKGIYFGIECFVKNAESITANAVPTTGERYPLNYSAVWRDDSIEIMLDPGLTRAEFYHFAVNARGAMFNSKKSQSGTVMEKWNGDWQAASRIGNDRWTCEIFIPFHTLPLNPRVSNGWGVNVCRTTTKPLENASISHDGTFNRPQGFRKLTGINADLSPYMWKVVSEAHPKICDGKKSNFITATVENSTGVARQVSAQVFAGDAEKSYSLSLGPDENKEIDLSGVLAGEGETQLFDMVLSDAGTGEVLSFNHHSLSLETAIMRVGITDPYYRDTIYATQKVNAIHTKVDALVPASETVGWKASANLVSGGKDISSSAVVQLKKGSAELVIPARKLAVGEYEIVVSLRDENGRLLAAEQKSIRKLAAHKGEVRLDRNNVLLVDGKPFLPVGYMGVLPEDMETIAHGGGNTVHNYVPYHWTPEMSAGFMAEARRLNLKVVLPPWGGSDDYSNLSPSLSADEKESITRQVDLYKDHPNFLAWYMYDEPEGVGSPVSRLRELYQLVRGLDPYHPCIMLNDSLHGIDAYAGTADIMMPDPYCQPTIKNFTAPMIKVADFMDQIAKTSPKSAAWACLQAFDYGEQRDNLITDRAPSLDEFRSMTWLTTNHGCKGFIHYAWPYTFTSPDLNLGLPYILQELNALSEVVLSPQKKKVVAAPQDSGVDVVSVKHDGAVWIIAVNTLQEPREFTAVLPELGNADLKIVGEDSVAHVSKGKLQDRLHASETRIYTNGNPNFRLRKAEVQKAIDAVAAGRRKPGNLAFWVENGTVAKASSWVVENQFGSPRSVIDGIMSETGDSGWKGRDADFPGWIQLTWPEPKEIAGVVLYSHNLKGYELQYHKDDAWVTLGSFGGDVDFQVKTEHAFTPVRTNAVRVFINAASGKNSIISEIECYSRWASLKPSVSAGKGD